MMFFLYLVFGCFLYSAIDAVTYERELGVLNFTCPNSKGTHLEKLTIVEAKGENDVLYYFWDFGYKPTFLIVQVPKGSEVKLNCSRFLNNESDSIEFSSKPVVMFGAMLNKLYEFNDQNDTATFNPNDPTNRQYDGEAFHWNTSFSQSTNPIPLDAVRAVGTFSNSNISGTFEMAVGAYTGDGSSVEPPHILHTANGSQVDIILNNFQTTFNQSRFAVQIIILGSSSDLNYISDVKETVDDENTPGVFKLNTITFERPEKYRDLNRGYILWRPLVYKSDARVVGNTTGTKNYNMTDIDDKYSLFNHTLLKSIYGDVLPQLFAKGLVISFGAKTDKFYQNTKYSCWSFVFGAGESPDPDEYSIFYLIFFTVCVVVSVILSTFIELNLIKLRSRDRERNGFRESITDNEES